MPTPFRSSAAWPRRASMLGAGNSRRLIAFDCPGSSRSLLLPLAWNWITRARSPPSFSS